MTCKKVISENSMRKNWLDNLRWFTVLLVLFYHVFYFYNNKGVFGGVGGFDPDPMKQPQDIVLYILYPWFMMLLFLLAGISARYSLEKRSAKEFRKSRTLKLLVPSTIGLLVFQWTTGYFNVNCGAEHPDLSQVPAMFRWLIYSVSGSGPLWFAQELWIFSLLLLLIRKLDPKDKFRNFCAKASTPVIILMGVLIWFGSQFMIMEPRLESLDGMFNLYRPLAYFVPFLMGYFVFCNDGVLERVKAMCVPMTVCAVAAGIVLCITGWGRDYTGPQYLTGWLNCLYAWLMILAVMGIFMRWFDGTNRFCAYMNRSSYGFYVLHYSILVSFGYMFKTYTQMPAWLIYIALAATVFTLTPLLYEILRRIPLLRWAVLGENK